MLKVKYSNGQINYYDGNYSDVNNAIEESKRYKEVSTETIQGKKTVLFTLKKSDIKYTVNSAIIEGLRADIKKVGYDEFGNITFNGSKVYSQNYYIDTKYYGKQIFIIEEV